MPIVLIAGHAAEGVGLGGDADVVHGIALVGHQIGADTQQGDQADRQQNKRDLP
jgi:hypothetical protein